MNRATKLALALCSAATLMLASTASAALAGSGKAKVADNVPTWAKSANAIGHANPNGKVYVSVYLNPRNPSELRSTLKDLYTRGSGMYHQWLTPAAFHNRFGASDSTVKAVASFLSNQGLKVTATPSHHMYVDAQGSVAQVEKAFAVTENMYSYKGLKLRSNDVAPSIPTSLAGSIAFIGGLDDSDNLITTGTRNNDPAAPPGFGYSTPGPCSTYWGQKTENNTSYAGKIAPAPNYGDNLPWVPCGYNPPQMRAAYGVDETNLTGRGATIGITDAFASPTIVQDANRFSQHYGLPLLNDSNFTQIFAPGTPNHGASSILDPQGWYGEETLDIEWAHAMAPAAKIVYSGANNNEVPLDHALENLIDANQVDIITNSWGINGEYSQYGHYKTEEMAFQQAAAQGISVLFSSGDSGDVAASRGIAQGSYPSTSPWVTSVGGTSLALKNASGAKSEWGWGTYLSNYDTTTDTFTPWPPDFLYGAGGGVSLHFAQPDYQKGVVPASLSTRTTTIDGRTITFSSPHRVTPDVGMDADPNTGALYGETYQISGDPLIDAGCTRLSSQFEYCERRIGGTSLASPLFAGVVALGVQANGGNRVGLVNYALYDTATTTSGGVIDVLPPASPTAALRNVEHYDASGNPFLATTLRTMNSTVENGKVIEGADTSLRTTAGYDNVTGVGSPYAPTLATVLANHS